MFKKFLRALNQHLEEYLIALFLIAITFVMLLQIVMRYVFQHSLSWPEEFSRYCFVYYIVYCRIFLAAGNRVGGDFIRSKKR